MLRAALSRVQISRIPRGVQARLASNDGAVNQSGGAFKDREHALENQYFNKDELAKLEALKKKLEGASGQTSAKAADKEVPTIHHGPAYVSLETFQKFASDVLKSVKRLEDAASKKK